MKADTVMTLALRQVIHGMAKAIISGRLIAAQNALTETTDTDTRLPIGDMVVTLARHRTTRDMPKSITSDRLIMERNAATATKHTDMNSLTEDTNAILDPHRIVVQNPAAGVTSVRRLADLVENAVNLIPIAKLLVADTIMISLRLVMLPQMTAANALDHQTILVDEVDIAQRVKWPGGNKVAISALHRAVLTARRTNGWARHLETAVAVVSSIRAVKVNVVIGGVFLIGERPDETMIGQLRVHHCLKDFAAVVEVRDPMNPKPNEMRMMDLRVAIQPLIAVTMAVHHEQPAMTTMGPNDRVEDLVETRRTTLDHRGGIRNFPTASQQSIRTRQSGRSMPLNSVNNPFAAHVACIDLLGEVFRGFFEYGE